MKFREILNALARLREEPGVVIRLAKVLKVGQNGAGVIIKVRVLLDVLNMFKLDMIN